MSTTCGILVEAAHALVAPYLSNSFDLLLKTRFLPVATMTQPKPSLDDLRIERGAAPESKSKIWLIALLLLVIGGGAAAWFFLRPRAVAVRTVPAREVASNGGARTILNASGYVTARRSATASSKITGKVMEVFIEEGTKVQEGQILARLDDTNVKASLGLAEAQLEAARKALAETKVRIKEADQELNRQSDLVKTQIATQADYEHAEAASHAASFSASATSA